MGNLMLRRPATLRNAATPARSQSVAITVALDLKRHLVETSNR